MHMNPGARLGRYEILDLLGRGGMGEVYRARDSRLDRVVAIKTLPAAVAFDAEARARFEREARAVAALSHPNILAIYDVGEEAGTLFVVTELLEGQTLAARLCQGPMDPEAARGYALQLARGLAAAHARGILHRDLKPANVFVTKVDQLKILDFGLAIMMAPGGGESDETRADFHTSPGLFLGTPAYMSPEQMRNHVVDHRGDLFSFGALLYEMLAGDRPFDGPSVADVVTAVLTSEPPPLGGASPLARRLDSIARRCLSKAPDRRFQSTEEVIGALLAADATSHAGVVDATTERQASIAVLPFSDLSEDQHLGYLCDGLAEEILSGLSRVAGLRVAARTSSFQFKGKSEDVKRIGHALGVEAVLEGSIRAAGSRLRVTTQMVNVADGYQIWSERFDRDGGDVFAIEDEIADAVVGALKGRMGQPIGMPGLERGTVDVEAYTLYLKGRYHWNKRTERSLREAAALFQAALQRDPTYGAAYGAMADVFVTLGVYGAAAPADVMPKAKAAAARALSLSASVPGVKATLATVMAVYDWKWAEADRQFIDAVTSDADHATTLQWQAVHHLIPLGRFAEADAALARALALDPLSLIIAVTQGLSALFARRYDDAVRVCRTQLSLDPGFAMGQFFLGQAYAAQGKLAEATDALTQAVALSDRSPDMIASLGYVHARAGRAAEAQAILADLEAREAARYISPVLAAYVHIGLGDVDAAMAALERGADVRAAELVWIGVRPVFDKLRDDSRFVALCARIGVPARVSIPS